MTTDIIIKIGLPIINALVAIFLIPWLRQLAKTSKDKRIFKFIKIACKSAEQIFGGKSGNVKYNHVLVNTMQKYAGLGLDVIDTYIEASVKELKEDNLEQKDQTEIQKKNYNAKVNINKPTGMVSRKKIS